jgi:hypothetical protein
MCRPVVDDEDPVRHVADRAPAAVAERRRLVEQASLHVRRDVLGVPSEQVGEDDSRREAAGRTLALRLAEDDEPAPARRVGAKFDELRVVRQS